jgi:gas vesicle protein
VNFVVGLGIGFGLGMLFAPMRGEEMRQVIAEKGTQVLNTAQELGKGAQAAVQEAGS